MRRPDVRRHPALASVADQAVSSGSNFLVSVAIGRLGGASELGGFAIALFVWVAIIGVQRAVLSEPLIIVERDPGEPALLRRVFGSALVLALIIAAVVGAIALVLLATGVSGIGGPLGAFACVLPLLLGQDLWRAVAFGVHRPERALANDLLFIVVQVALMLSFAARDLTSAPWFVLAWGIGAAVGLAFGFVQFRLAPVLRPSLAVIRELWPTSRWLLRDFLTLFGARETYLIVVAVFVTSAEFGGLRAAESLLGPSAVILLSGGNVGLPGATRAYRRGGSPELARYSRKMTLAVGLAQWTFCGLMALFGPWLLVELYGPEFEPYAYLVWFLAVRYAISVVNFGPSIAIKVAGLAREMFLARLVVTVISLPTAIVATAVYGLNGAAVASVAFAVALVLALYYVYIPGVARAGSGAGHQPAAASIRSPRDDRSPAL
jgi:O-antigen/teichoic acid export membrane protein